MIVNFEYFIDDSDDDSLFVIERNNKRKGFVDLCFDIDSKVYGDDE